MVVTISDVRSVNFLLFVRSTWRLNTTGSYGPPTHLPLVATFGMFPQVDSIASFT
ncbi:hypothetical protein B0I08_104166 [Glaciihabitans tibetensis]|uniref:Uncharacterized protein n=1 Tax=Glaciihabitans tibetensis TaxID=1266600 RepID=A0A2T0VE68_9MICO|nr:hypothetical protein B0I08_104166 [Glaciihabitans tibetensis]